MGEQFDHSLLMAHLQILPGHRKLFAQLMNELVEEGFLKPLGTRWQVLKALPSKKKPLCKI